MKFKVFEGEVVGDGVDEGVVVGGGGGGGGEDEDGVGADGEGLD